VNRFARLVCAYVIIAVPIMSSGCGRSAAAKETAASYLGKSAIVRFVSPLPSGPDACGLVGMAAHSTVSRPPRWAKGFGRGVNGVHTRRKIVALTFDDGPSPATRTLVDDLHRAKAHATFFWVGSRITTDAARYAITHGEELANHTWSHPNMRRLTSEEASAQIGMTSARIAEFTGRPPTWFRSPFSRVYQEELAQIRAHGLLYANYEVTGADWMDRSTRTDVLRHIDAQLRPGSIIIMHDTLRNDTEYLPAVLKLLKRRGYQLVTLTALAHAGSPMERPFTLGSQGLTR